MPKNQPTNLIKNIFQRMQRDIVPEKAINDSSQSVIDQLKEKLQAHQKYLHHFEQIAQSGSWEYIIKEDQLYCSDNFLEIFGLDFDQHHSIETPFALIHPEDYSFTRERLENAYQGQGFSIEFRIFHGKTKQLRYLKAQAEVIWNQGKPFKVIGVIHDQTSVKELEIEMRNTSKNYQHIFDRLHAAIWVKDISSNTILFVSQGAESLLEMPLETIYSTTNIWEALVHSDDQQEVFENQQAIYNGKTIHQMYRIQLPNGKIKWVYDQTSPWLNADQQLIRLFGFLIDITTEKELQEKLNYLAKYDELTDLPNQHQAIDKLEKLISNNKAFAVLYFDLDRFSSINESLGYNLGDQALKKVAEKLTIIANKHFLARFNSSDFLLIVDSYQSKADIFDLSEQFIQIMQEPIQIHSYEIVLTTSIGISFYPEDGKEPVSILEKAHHSLLKAKKLGKNNFQTLSLEENISAYRQYILEKDMKKAIDQHEFEIYYQPIVHTKTGVIESAEALLRWNHSDWGVVPANEFISLAEENHYIHEIGDWVIEQVLKQLADWRSNGSTLRPISINISPTRFYKKGFFSFVKTMLDHYQVPAKYIILEITERSLLTNEHNVLLTLKKLQALGIKISIDDFGIGYSSLQYLRDMAFDIIKIDKLFIQDITGAASKDKVIISSLLHLAKGLNMTIIAEGVETFEQYAFLKQSECSLIQGYILSKPMPVEQYEQINEAGYLSLPKPISRKKPAVERRKYYRFTFNAMIIGELKIIRVNKKDVDLAGTDILIENISLEGLKIMSHLDLPIHSNVEFSFSFTLLDNTFTYSGQLIWKEEMNGDYFYYGVHFPDITEQQKDNLAQLLNKMTMLEKQQRKIHGTNFLDIHPFLYLKQLQTNKTF